MLNVALLCTNTLPTQRPRMSSVVNMLCGQAPIEVVPHDDLSDDLQLNIFQSRQSMNSSRTDWSCAPASDPSILLHNSKDSGYRPSSSSSSLKLWAAAPRLARLTMLAIIGPNAATVHRQVFRWMFLVPNFWCCLPVVIQVSHSLWRIISVMHPTRQDVKLALWSVVSKCLILPRAPKDLLLSSVKTGCELDGIDVNYAKCIEHIYWCESCGLAVRHLLRNLSSKIIVFCVRRGTNV